MVGLSWEDKNRYSSQSVFTFNGLSGGLHPGVEVIALHIRVVIRQLKYGYGGYGGYNVY